MDSPHEDEVEIVIAEHDDGWRLWVNVGGENRLRIYRIKHLHCRTSVADLAKLVGASLPEIRHD